jgi:hypothetical protein
VGRIIRTGVLPPPRLINATPAITMMTTKAPRTTTANFLNFDSGMSFLKDLTVVLCLTPVSDYNLPQFLTKGVTVEHQ